MAGIFFVLNTNTLHVETLKAVDPMMRKMSFIWNCTFLRSFRFPSHDYGWECFRSWHFPIFPDSTFLKVITMSGQIVVNRDVLGLGICQYFTPSPWPRQKNAKSWDVAIVGKNISQKTKIIGPENVIFGNIAFFQIILIYHDVFLWRIHINFRIPITGTWQAKR